ncbi:MAG TPA: peptidase U32 [Ruminococcaceae bacterium]|nr:peptidase U32 [Oscillospiraceae bacterium]
MNRPEVLAPAGSWDTLRAAVFAGADAVYFGGQSFNARRRADNFDDESIGDAVSFLHARGAKAYITFNTILFQEELEKALAFLKHLCAIGADALIVQDMGLLRLIRQAAPQMPVHASTQMAVHNIEGVRTLVSLGASRVVLARELSEQEMAGILFSLHKEAEMTGNLVPEIEVFVHGAHCMSMSGQCYFSALLGGRSGNRGLCAQVCRLPFSAPGGTGHDLSLKDLSLAEQVPLLAQMGVSSLKIEGRMKRPEYVDASVRVFSAAARGEVIPQEQMNFLRDVFSRNGFTQGYFQGKRGKQMFGSRSHEDVLASGRAVSAWHGADKEQPRIPVELSFSLHVGEPVFLQAKDQDGNEARATGPCPEVAKHHATEKEVVAEHLQKTGGTPFYIQACKVEMDKGMALPVRVLNALRRDALSGLLELRSRPHSISYTQPQIPRGRMRETEKTVRVRLYSAKQLTANCFQGIERIYLPLHCFIRPDDALLKAIENKWPLGVELPRACFGSTEQLKPALQSAWKLGARHALCGNIGQFSLAQSLGFVLHGDYALNCANTASALEYTQIGAVDEVLSFETSLIRAQKMGGAKMGMLAYGRLPLMLTRNCPLKNGEGCSSCAGVLTDRMGVQFPVRCGAAGDCVEILGDRPLWMFDRLSEMWQTGLSFLQLYFTIETPDEVARVVQAFHEGRPCTEKFTRGLYTRGVQ